MWLAIMGANHDPSVFDCPDALRLDRAPNPHLAFGGGAHFCLGAALARSEARIALTHLFERHPRLAIASARLEWSPTLVDRSLLALPVRIAV
jgi:cytochrome P450